MRARGTLLSSFLGPLRAKRTQSGREEGVYHVKGKASCPGLLLCTESLQNSLKKPSPELRHITLACVPTLHWVPI